MPSTALPEVPRRPAYAEIDRAALAHNLSVARSLISRSTKIMAIVKADAYGHGAVECAQTFRAAGAELLGVALLQEAVELRRAGLDCPILVLTPPMPEEADTYAAHAISFTLASLETARIFAARAVAAGTVVHAHVKVDTGMGRVGITPSSALAFVSAASALPGLVLDGIATHFAASDDNMQMTEAQWKEFANLLATIGAVGFSFSYVHAANSGAVMNMPSAHGSCVRPGIMLYGYAPERGHVVGGQLRPVLSLRARVDFVKRVPAGTSISYGARYVTRRETSIATVPIGYADGYTRRLTGLSEVLIRGDRRPVAGTICMDQIMIDAGDLNVQEGETVTLIGDDGGARIDAWDLAAKTGTIPYEILTGISARVPRVYL